MSQPLCLASCFLPLDATNSRWWKQLQDALARRGMELVLISQSLAADPELRTIVVPLWTQGYSDAFQAPASPLVLEEPLAQTLAEREQAWLQQESQEPARGRASLSECQTVLRAVLDELQPAVVLVWGSGLSQSVILQQLAVQRGLPCWVLERGLLPGTLMLEMHGHGGHSELNWSFALQRACRQNTATDRFFAAQQQLHRARESKYAQGEFLTAADFRQKYSPAGHRIIAALLQHDGASGLVPAEQPAARLHAPGIATSEAAVAELARALAAYPDCLLLVKPHPMDARDYSRWEGPRVRVVREAHLHSLIQAADVVASMTSTAQYEALLYEKPLLLLARSALAGKDVAYEALTVEALPGALRSALHREDFAARLTAARGFLHFVLEHFSVALSDNSAAGASLEDLVDFLARNAGGPASPRSSEAGLAGLKRAFDAWRNRAGHPTPSPPNPASGNDAALLNHTTPMKYHSHIGQDAWVAECLQFKRNGFFLDFGAFDGKTISNTLALEEGLGWRGICVEPNPRYYPILCECRKCVTVNVALWPKSRELVRFVDAHGLSSIEEFKSGDINADRRQNATTSIIEVDTLNPNELLARFNAPKLIDYLTLDVEGAEFDILSALDLTTYAIALMTIEHNHDKERQEKMRNYLARFGYEVVQNRNDDFFFHRGHLTRLLEEQRKAADPVAVCNHLYDTFPIAETGGGKTETAKTPAKAASVNGSSPATKIMDVLSRCPGTLRVVASALREQHAWEEAELIYQKLVRHYPDDVELWRERLECCRSKGHGVLADLLCEEALERHPEWQKALAAV